MMHSRSLNQKEAGLNLKQWSLDCGQTSLVAAAGSIGSVAASCCSHCFVSKAQGVRVEFAAATPPIRRAIEMLDWGLANFMGPSKRSELGQDSSFVD